MQNFKHERAHFQQFKVRSCVWHETGWLIFIRHFKEKGSPVKRLTLTSFEFECVCRINSFGPHLLHLRTDCVELVIIIIGSSICLHYGCKILDYIIEFVVHLYEHVKCEKCVDCIQSFALKTFFSFSKDIIL